MTTYRRSLLVSPFGTLGQEPEVITLILSPLAALSLARSLVG
jgi:hypothetical protein